MGKYIEVKLEIEGLQHWPDCNLPHVEYLKHLHRHTFVSNCRAEVSHGDRDIEFIQFKRWLENLYKDAILSLDHKSCEMMSDDLYDSISKKYPGREIWIEVSEDGENGSFIKY